jgi:hypothetical protein
MRFLRQPQAILAVLSIDPPGPENSGSTAEACNNKVHLLGMVHIVNLMYCLQPGVVQWLAGSSFSEAQCTVGVRT